MAKVTEKRQVGKKKKRKKKRHPNRRKKVKVLSLRTESMILYIENPKESTQNLLEINKQVQQGYKINIQVSYTYLYVHNYTCYI